MSVKIRISIKSLISVFALSVLLSGCSSTRLPIEVEESGVEAIGEIVNSATDDPGAIGTSQKVEQNITPELASDKAEKKMLSVIAFEPSDNPLNYSILSSARQNLNRNGQASPVQIRIYQLKNETLFKSVDYLTLLTSDDKALGADQLSKKFHTVFPGEDHVNQQIGLSRKTRYIGVVGAFREHHSQVTTRFIKVNPEIQQFICISIDESGLKLDRIKSMADCHQ